jgi:sulfonate transport system substrate-binding protein
MPRVRVWLVAALAVVSSACSRTDGAGATKQEAKTRGTNDRHVVLKFSDPANAGPLAYAKREHIFEPELAKVDAEIEWVPAAGAFSANFEAMNAGAINASGAAVSPIVGALAHNLKFKIFSIGDPSDTRQAGIISPRGSSIRRVQDLAGKRVAVNWAAHGDYILLRSLEREHIPAASVTRVPIQPPEAAAAFATGKIDAWSTFGVFFLTAVKNGANVLAMESELESDDVTVTSANVELLRKNPAAFRTFIEVHSRLVELGHREPEQFQNVFTDKGPTAVTGDLLKAAIETTRVAPIQRIPTAGDKKRVGNVAKLLFENKSIDRDIAADEIVYDLNGAAPSGAVAAGRAP